MRYDNLEMMTEEDSPEDIIEALIKDNKEALRTGDYTAADTIRLLMDRVNRLIELEDWMEELENSLVQMCHCRRDEDIDTSVGQEYESCPACKALDLFPTKETTND